MATSSREEFSSTQGFVNLRASNTPATSADEISYASLVEGCRKTFASGRTKKLEWRKQQLRQLKKLVVENHERIAEALVKDLGGPKWRAAVDMGAGGKADEFISKLEEWTAPIVVPHVSFFGRSYIRKEPKGVILLVAPWNFPFAMVFDALGPMIAAGNCVVIKPSEVSANTCDIMAELIPKYFDNDAIKVVTGGVPETTALLREKFDHIFYTGNGAVGRIIMQAAAKHLTPVTLELGGKSPVYVDKSAKIDVAVKRVSGMKWFNAGQICVAPDYVLVHEDVMDAFKNGVVNMVKEHYGSTMEERLRNKNFGAIIHAGHVKRIGKLVDSTTGKVLVGGGRDADTRAFEPTILENPSLEDEILKEEIFGPVLPIMSVKNVEEAARKVNQIASNPLALYVFAERQSAIDHFLDNTNSGGVCVNGVLEQLTNHNLPFGGVGESGFGRYHGKWGLDEFSHFRSVLVKDTVMPELVEFPPKPPYKDSLYDAIMKFSVLGFFSDAQKSAFKVGGVALAALAGYKIMQSKL